MAHFHSYSGLLYCHILFFIVAVDAVGGDGGGVLLLAVTLFMQCIDC